MNHLRFLRYIDAIARHGSITKASERLHVVPSAVNRRLQDIEEELGTQLFERMPRGMRLTAAGELFVRYIRSRDTELERVRSQIEDLKGLRRGTVRLAVSQALATQFIPRAIAQFRQSHPLVEFDVNVGDHGYALSALRDYESDLALVINLEPEPDMNRIAVAEDRLVAMMHREHPLASSKAVRLRQCLEYPLALANRQTAGRQILERFLVKSSLEMRPAIQSNNFEFLRMCLLDRQTITFQLAVGTHVDSEEFVTLPLEDRGLPRAQLVLASLAGRHLPLVASSFAAQVEEQLYRREADA